MSKTIYMQVRIPKVLHKLLKVSAKRNLRSINSEIIAAIAIYLGVEGGTPELVSKMMKILKEEGL